MRPHQEQQVKREEEQANWVRDLQRQQAAHFERMVKAVEINANSQAEQAQAQAELARAVGSLERCMGEISKGMAVLLERTGGCEARNQLKPRARKEGP